MKRLVGSLGILILLTSTSFLRADGVGTSVTASLTFQGFGTTNYFDAANGFVPHGFGNTGGLTNVTIGPGIEFGFEDAGNLDTADFTGTTLTITDTSSIGGSNSFEMRFTDPAFLSFALMSDSLGISYGFSETTLIVDFANQNIKGSGSAVFSYTSSPINAPVPEPGTLELLATGLTGAASLLRRKSSI